MSFPAGIRIRRDSWAFSPRLRQTGPTIAAQDQRIEGPNARWALNVTVLIKRTDTLAWNAFIDRHDGGRRPAMLGPRFHRAPSTQLYNDDGGFSDGTTFSDGTYFISELEPPGPITVIGDVSTWGTSLMLERVTDRALTSADWAVGTRFGLAGRMYQIRGVTIPTGSPTTDWKRATVSIWPPLRADVADGTGLDATPRAPMMLVDPDAGVIDDMPQQGTQELTLDWIEDLSGREVMDG